MKDEKDHSLAHSAASRLPARLAKLPTWQVLALLLVEAAIVPLPVQITAFYAPSYYAFTNFAGLSWRDGGGSGNLQVTAGKHSS